MPLEKMVFSLVIASRNLRHYFNTHPIKVLTSHPIRATLRKAKLVSRMEKWSVKLNIFHLDYEPRTTIKVQVLTYLIAEFHDDTVGEPAIPTPPTRVRVSHHLIRNRNEQADGATWY